MRACLKVFLCRNGRPRNRYESNILGNDPCPAGLISVYGICAGTGAIAVRPITSYNLTSHRFFISHTVAPPQRENIEPAACISCINIFTELKLQNVPKTDCVSGMRFFYGDCVPYVGYFLDYSPKRKLDLDCMDSSPKNTRNHNTNFSNYSLKTRIYNSFQEAMYANSRKPYAFGNVGAEQCVIQMRFCDALFVSPEILWLVADFSKCYSHLKKNGLCLPNALMVDIRVGGVASQVFILHP